PNSTSEISRLSGSTSSSSNGRPVLGKSAFCNRNKPASGFYCFSPEKGEDGEMKGIATGIIVAVACMFFSSAHAQGVKGAKSYFPKAYPAPANGVQAGAVAPGTGQPVQPP